MDVFISYAHEDRVAVRELAEVFERDGLSVWWDRELNVGAEFAHIIEEELDKAKAVVVVWSQAGTKSRWVRSEASVGLDRNILVPVSIDNARVPLPFGACATALLIDWPNQSSELELTKLRKTLLEFCRPQDDTSTGIDLNLAKVDPTLSIRVATRVAGLISQDSETAALQLEFEQIISEVAIQLATEGSSDQLLIVFLARMQRMLAADLNSFSIQNETVFGNSDLCDNPIIAAITEPVKLITKDEALESSERKLIDSIGTRWILVVKNTALTLCLAGYVSDPPNAVILKRCDLLLRLMMMFIKTKRERALI